MENWRKYEEQGAMCHDKGDAAGAAESYMQAALNDKYLRSQRTHYSNYLFALHYLSGIDTTDLANEHFTYDSLYRDVERITPTVIGCTIGYIAESFVESSVARFIEAILTGHSDKFIIKVFSLTSANDKFTERIRNSVNKYIELTNMSIEESAERIAIEQVDILFDFSGHTDGGMTLQILGYKPAAIQISGIGWFDTTGLNAIDYILTDNYLSPIGSERYFSEKLLRLNAAFSFMPTDDMRKCNIIHNNDTITFGCFNNFMKVTNEYLQTVKRIMKKVPNSKFIMQDTTTLTERKIEMERRIQKFGLPIERIEIRLGRTDYLSEYAEIDIMLDTFPYNGGFMTATGLYMNVPVISLYGERHSSRFGADILRLAGLTKLIANNLNEYIKLAVELATNENQLNAMRSGLRERIERSTLFDTATYVKELEFFYRQLIA